ncbi:MAG: UDP-N-acetylglucosamine 2-epimerase (non-hydrolyzing) [Bacteroidales bacterium]|nr:UDP-N-acetylglucosamine 2-epimerase (non-hydrolyzing) [Bacteroidales bacterium]
MKILTIVGARPQIIKAAAVSRAMREVYPELIEERILHTGQHYDDAMSGLFFDELDIPRPAYNLGVGSATHGRQTARMLEGIEEVLLSDKFDAVIVYGDTNSTLAGALAASKLHIPLHHVEAGLRSRNMAMPEEVNRLVADRLSSLLFAPTEEACINLRHEGYKEEAIVNSGDVMYDNVLHFANLSRTYSHIVESLGLEGKRFALATVHRDFNTDNPKRLGDIMTALDTIAANGTPVVLPLHPRTKGRLSTTSYPHITFTEPVQYLDTLQLESNAQVVLTDSGGVQKEAYFMRRPCVILRPETEWVEIVRNGAAELADADTNRILQAYYRMSGITVAEPTAYGDGNAAKKIIIKIVNFAQ